MIITIDGPAGSGKSTVASLLSDKLNFIHLNSGSLYRALTCYLYSTHFNIPSITEDFPTFDLNLEVKFIDNNQHTFVNGIDFTDMLRDNIISQLAPFISTNKSLRATIDACQKDFCNKHDVVLEGRDLGSYVFPNAEIKFYLDCSIKERARRRYLEELNKNNIVSIEEIEKQIEKRDFTDKTKKIAPLVVPKDAVVIDSSTLTIEQVLEAMISVVENIKSKSNK